MAIHALFAEAPKQFSQDYVGRIRTGTQLNSRPMALETFRFTTGDPTLADQLAHTYGGTVAEWDTSSDESLEVITETNTLDVQLKSLRSEYVLWTRNGLARSCDGVTQRDETPCHCKTQYSSQREWNQASKQGLACSPSVESTMTLDAMPDSGLFTFKSQSKTLANGDPAWKKDKVIEGEVYSPPINDVEALLAQLDHDTKATLQLVGVSYTTKTGQPVSYMKPVITIKQKAAV